MVNIVRSFNFDKFYKYHEGITKNRGYSVKEVIYQNSPKLLLGNTFSIEVWFDKPDNLSGSFYLLDLFNIFNVELLSNGNIYLNANDSTFYEVTGLLSKNHLVITKSGLFYNIYLNGIFLSQEGNIGTILNFFDSYLDERAIKSYGTDYVKIYNIKIWNKVFSSLEISSYYNIGYNTPIVENEKLIAFWNFEKISNNYIPGSGISSSYGKIIYGERTWPEFSKSPYWLRTNFSRPYINNRSFVNYVNNITDDEFTIEGWIYPSGINSQVSLFEFKSYGKSNIKLQLNTDTVLLSVTDLNNNNSIHESTNTIIDQQWNHILVGWKAAQSSNNPERYIAINNNLEIFNGTNQSLLDYNNASGLVFGGDESYTCGFRNFRFYHKQLDPSEINNTYTYFTEYSVPYDYLIAEWKFIENATSWVYDCTNHGNNLLPPVISGSQTYTWECKESGGPFPLAWEGYSLAPTSQKTNSGSFFNNLAGNLDWINFENVIIESLYFKAYDNNKYPSGTEGSPGISSFPFALYYGPYIIVNADDTSDGNIRYVQYASGISVSTYPTNPIFGDSSKRINPLEDGKWHHTIAVYSKNQTLPGTNYNCIIYDNGKLAAATTLSLPDLPWDSPPNTGSPVIGHYLNGAVRIARLYLSSSGILDWFNGTNVANSPDYFYSSCKNLEGRVLDITINDDNTVLEKISGTVLNKNSHVIISRIPLSYTYFGIDGTLPNYPTPKFSIAAFEKSGEGYGLICNFEINIKDTNIYTTIFSNDKFKLYSISGLYFANIADNIYVSGLLYSNVPHHVMFRYDNNLLSCVFDGNEIYSNSGVWSEPEETTKWGFYANSITNPNKVFINHISSYDSWVDEAYYLKLSNTKDVFNLPLTTDIYLRNV